LRALQSLFFYSSILFSDFRRLAGKGENDVSRPKKKEKSLSQIASAKLGFHFSIIVWIHDRHPQSIATLLCLD
jgi:hypothetical protein